MNIQFHSTSDSRHRQHAEGKGKMHVKLSRAMPAIAYFGLGCLCFIDPITFKGLDLTWYWAMIVFVPCTALCKRLWERPSIVDWLSSLGLICALLLAGRTSGQITRSLTYSGKLLFIFLILWPLFKSSIGSVHWLLRGAAAVVLANFALIALHLGAGLSTARLLAGRWGTLLSSPGIIGVSGVAVFSYYVLESINVGLSVRATLLLTAGLCVSLASGSRGVVVLCMLTMGSVVLQVIFGRRRARFKRAAFLLVAFSCLFVVLLIGADKNRGLAIPSRVIRIFNSETLGGDYFSGQDQARYEMVGDATEAIRNHPITGVGLYVLGAAGEGGLFQTIHNRYLGAWAELGILGFVTITAISLVWIPDFCRAFKHMRGRTPAHLRLTYTWAALTLVQFIAFGLFFPIGVQISDWAFYLVGRAIFSKTFGTAVDKRLHPVRQQSGAARQTAPCPRRPFSAQVHRIVT